MSFQILPGDCLEVLAEMPEASVDAIVTDPPYGLSAEPKAEEVLRHWLAGDDYEHRGGGFMGKSWDSFVPGPKVWAECLRVLKPGGHLVAFFGTRTVDLGGMAIRLAGFEIRDCLSWHHMKHVFCQCSPLPYEQNGLSREDLSGVRPTMATDDPVSGESEQDVQQEMRERGNEQSPRRPDEIESEDQGEVSGVRDGVSGLPEDTETNEESDLLAGVQREGPGPRMGETRGEGSSSLDGGEPGDIQREDVRSEESGLEGRGDLHSEEGQLRGDQICPGSGMGASDGAEGRLHNGTPPTNGAADRPPNDSDGGRPSPRSRSDEQRSDEPGTLAVEWIPQGGGVWPGCSRCGQPLAPPFDAGNLAWVFGSGFPKSLDVSKAIDKAAGAEREDVLEDKPRVMDNEVYGKGLGVGVIERRPATEAAREWQGWGTALKPAYEPVILARKPLTGTVAANVQEFGTGALNVDGCRVGTEGGYTIHTASAGDRRDRWEGNKVTGEKTDNGGRWPANVILDGEAGAMLDEQTGELPSQGGAAFDKGQTVYAGGWISPTDRREIGYGDTGGASRFFYTAKASRAERSAGLGSTSDSGGVIGGGLPVRNAHPLPTVKPVDLMRYLVRLVTPPGGTVLDPFTGSGTTGIAAGLEGFDFIGIEREAEYREIAEARLKWWADQEGETADILRRAGLAEKAKEQAREAGQASLFDEAV